MVVYFLFLYFHSCSQRSHLLHVDSYPSKCLWRRKFADAEFGHAGQTLKRILPSKHKDENLGTKSFVIHHRIRNTGTKQQLFFVFWKLRKRRKLVTDLLTKQRLQIIGAFSACFRGQGLRFSGKV